MHWTPPKYISDGQLKYKVRVVKNPAVAKLGFEKDVDVQGETDPVKMICRLKADMDSQRTEQTFWHEVVHILLWSTGTDNHDEVFVDAMAHALQRFVNHNPELMTMYSKLTDVPMPNTKRRTLKKRSQ